MPRRPRRRIFTHALCGAALLALAGCASAEVTAERLLADERARSAALHGMRAVGRLQPSWTDEWSVQLQVARPHFVRMAHTDSDSETTMTSDGVLWYGEYRTDSGKGEVATREVSKNGFGLWSQLLGLWPKNIVNFLLATPLPQDAEETPVLLAVSEGEGLIDAFGETLLRPAWLLRFAELDAYYDASGLLLALRWWDSEAFGVEEETEQEFRDAIQAARESGDEARATELERGLQAKFWRAIVIYEDWRSVSGVLLPFKITAGGPTQGLVITLDTIERNPSFAPQQFQLSTNTGSSDAAPAP